MNGYTLFTDENGDNFWWKDCETPACKNQICTWLSNHLCHPCTCKKAAKSVKILAETQEPTP